MFGFIFMLVLIVFLFLAVYFVPSFIAIGRKHSNLMQITLLNTFLGCTFIGWVLALIWASTDNVDEYAKTKGAWIIIAVVFVLSLSPLLFFSVIPTKYKSSVIQESQYKSVIYKSKSGKLIKQVTESNQTQEN